MYINGVRTDLGYSILTSGNKIINIYDNRNDINLETLKNKVHEKLKYEIIDHPKLNSYFDLLQNNRKTNENLQIDLERNFIYFDTSNNQWYFVTIHEEKNEHGQILVIDNYEEIE